MEKTNHYKKVFYTAIYFAETWTLNETDQKQIE